MPSMSIAVREAKWRIFSTSCAGHEAPVQRMMAPSSSFAVLAPHTGQLFGNSYGLESAGRLDSTTETISGMTSPARRTKTVSPLRTSLRRSSSSLCSVARDTVTPPTLTGLRCATGVSAPVRPTCTSMDSTSVDSSSGGNL